jgi:endonuclease/exonuclease/phosphatase family metal-dependent hydrolase
VSANATARILNWNIDPKFRELGQAILTRFPIRASRILRFKYQSGFWKPRQLLISSLPLLQRRIGGRIALVNELDRDGGTLVVYNLHLESRTTEHGRLLQLDEVLADADRYPAGTPVMVAGDLNAMHRHSPLIARMRQAGYTSCFGERRMRTHILIGALDWVFVKGPMTCEGAEVHRDFHASDHFPISAELRF